MYVGRPKYIIFEGFFDIQDDDGRVSFSESKLMRWDDVSVRNCFLQTPMHKPLKQLTESWKEADRSVARRTRWVLPWLEDRDDLEAFPNTREVIQLKESVVYVGEERLRLFSQML